VAQFGDSKEAGSNLHRHSANDRCVAELPDNHLSISCPAVEEGIAIELAGWAEFWAQPASCELTLTIFDMRRTSEHAADRPFSAKWSRSTIGMIRLAEEAGIP